MCHFLCWKQNGRHTYSLERLVDVLFWSLHPSIHPSPPFSTCSAEFGIKI